METKFKQRLLPVIAAGILLATSCTNDQEIKADIAQKAKNDLNFAGVNYTVQNKIVTLTGNCPSVKARQKVWQTVKDINVISGIVNRVQIAPVILNEDLTLKEAADSVLADYPGVTATVKNGRIALAGMVDQEAGKQLKMAIGRLPAAAVETGLIIVRQ